MKGLDKKAIYEGNKANRPLSKPPHLVRDVLRLGYNTLQSRCGGKVEKESIKTIREVFGIPIMLKQEKKKGVKNGG